ncbi:MAG: discoidin domain-containing protein, partial [Aridibacter sp.]
MAKRIVNLADESIDESSNKTDKTKTKSKKQALITRLRNIERRKLFSNFAIVGLLLLVSIGAMAQMGLLPHIDKQSGQKYGWFGAELSADTTRLWNPFAAPPQSGTPQLSKEYVYAGDRLLAIEETGSGASSTPTPTATTTPTPSSGRMNYALATMGSVATASSFAGGDYLPSKTINGDRRGYTWTTNNLWVSDAGLPHWLEINFGQARTIDEIDVFTIQDDAWNPVEPNMQMEFTSTYGNIDFNVQYWNGSAWVTINSVTGNRKVWKQFTFAPITTSKIRVNITGSADDYAYMTEVEA